VCIDLRIPRYHGVKGKPSRQRRDLPISRREAPADQLRGGARRRDAPQRHVAVAKRGS